MEELFCKIENFLMEELLQKMYDFFPKMGHYFRKWSRHFWKCALLFRVNLPLDVCSPAPEFLIII